MATPVSVVPRRERQKAFSLWNKACQRDQTPPQKKSAGGEAVYFSPNSTSSTALLCARTRCVRHVGMQAVDHADGRAGLALLSGRRRAMIALNGQLSINSTHLMMALLHTRKLVGSKAGDH